MNLAELKRMVQEGDLSTVALRYLIDCRGECEWLDYKLALRLDYPDKAQQVKAVADFTKDVLAMANTGGGYIVIGVQDKTWRPVGLGAALPYDAKLLRDKIFSGSGLHLDVDIVQHELMYDGQPGLFAVILVRDAREGGRRAPHVVTKNFPGDSHPHLLRGQIYARRGDSSVVVDTPEMLERLLHQLDRQASHALPDEVPELIRLCGGHLEAERYEQLLEAVRHWQSVEPQDWRPIVWFAEAYKGLGRWREAVKAYEQVVVHLPERVEVWMGMTRCAREAGDIETELKAVRQWALRDGHDFMAHKAFGSALLRGGQPGGAMVALQRAMDLAPQDHALVRMMAQALEDQKRWAEAVTAYRTYLACERDDAGAWGHMWIAAVHSDDLQAQLEAAVGWTRTEPDRAAAWEGRAHALIMLRSPEMAIDAADRALALDPDRLLARKDLGMALYLTGRLDRLRAFLPRWPDMEPDEAAMAVQAQALCKLEKYAEAVELARRLLNRAPSSPTAWPILIRSLRGLGNEAEAVATARQWTQRYPAVMEARQTFSMELFDSGQWADAITVIDAGWPGSVNDPHVQTVKAKALKELGRHAEAVAAAERAVSLAGPGNSPTGVWQVQAWSLFELGHYDGAAAAAHSLLQHQPTDVMYLFLLARALGKARRFQEELDTAERWLAIESSASAWSRKVEALLGLNRIDEARHAADMLRLLRPDDANGLSLVDEAYARSGDRHQT